MSAIADLIERLRALIFRRREERELDEEIRFHLDMESAQQVRLGADPSEGRRRGLIALGGVERVKDDVREARGTQLIEETVGDVGYAIRTLVRRPGFAIVAILTLAIGIGGTTAVFSAVDAVLLQPLPYQQPGQLVRLYQYSMPYPDNGFVTPVHFLAYRSQLSSFEAVAGLYTYSRDGADVGGSERPERIQTLPVTAEYFGVLRAEPAIGRGIQTAEETDARVVVLSHALWQRELAGDRNAIGRTLTMSGVAHTVIGVMPEGFEDPLVGHVDAWIPIDLRPGLDVTNVDNHYLSVVARLRPGVTIARAQAELDVLGGRMAKEYADAKETRARLLPLKEDLVGPATRSLELMLGAVALVLVLVCVNIANLLLVRGSERVREFAVRSALGAKRTRLVRQLVIESIVLALAGDAAGLLVARGAMSAIVGLGAGSIPRLETLTLQPRLLLFSVVVASASAILFGLVPALRSARTQPSDVLREQARSTTGGRSQGRLRAGLVVSQVALAFVLLVGSGLLLASFERLQRVDLGVRTDHVLTFELALPPARYDSAARARVYEEFAQRIERIPGVRAAGGVSRLPATGEYHMWGTVALTGPLVGTREASVRPTPQQRVVSGDYFAALGIRVIAGRTFDARDDAAASRHFVVSKSLADRLFPGLAAVGQRLRAGGREGEIIGVVSDVAIDPEGTGQPSVYHAHRQFAGRVWALPQVIAASGAPEAVAADVRRTLAELDPQLVMYRPMPLAEAIGRGIANRVFTMRMLSSFAAVAIALAALGLFGVLSYAVKLRGREFGIRLALGAAGGSIRGMVLRQGLGITALGIGIGLLGALALSRVMASLVFGVSPLDPFVLAGAALLMTAIAVGAAYLPAYRATAVDPRSVLQGE